MTNPPNLADNFDITLTKIQSSLEKALNKNIFEQVLPYLIPIVISIVIGIGSFKVLTYRMDLVEIHMKTDVVHFKEIQKEITNIYSKLQDIDWQHKSFNKEFEDCCKDRKRGQ